MTLHDAQDSPKNIEWEVEEMLDVYGWDRVLSAIETVCYEKAAPLTPSLADTWQKAARAIGRVIGQRIV